jgi:6-phosphogluconolactonase
MKNFELISYATADELARTVAAKWLDEIEAAKRASKSHCVALSGGRITKKFFAAVTELATVRNFGDGDTPSLLTSVHFFWADERCVPPDNMESNFRLANELLFVPLKISESQIHRIRGELPPETAAAQAASELRRFASSNADGQPVLDLIFLGMGEDGHVASLFPGENEAATSDRSIYRAVKNSPKPPPNRVTIGYAAIAAARQIWVLVSGAGKEAALRESLGTNGCTPLAQVTKIRTQTRIYCDYLAI